MCLCETWGFSYADDTVGVGTSKDSVPWHILITDWNMKDPTTISWQRLGLRRVHIWMCSIYVDWNIDAIQCSNSVAK